MLNIPLMSNNISKDDVEKLICFLRETDRFTNGPKVREFERAWSEWLGVKYSVFVHSGSSANFMTMAGIAELYGTGEVIVPTITWVSDISSVIAAGHKPVFVDVDFRNLAMSEEEILGHITPETKAVFLTHVLGLNGLTERLVEELGRRKILLIEDVCESHGVCISGRKAGSIGFASNFSFYYAHHMSTIEGGMICTDDERFYQMMRMYRSHGMLRENDNAAYREEVQRANPDLNPEFIFMVPGYNMRSTELNAVIGMNQLGRLDAQIARRRENISLFLEGLDSRRYYTEFDLDGNSNYALIVILRDKDPELFRRLCGKLAEEKVEFRRGTAGGGNQTRQPFLKKRFPQLEPGSYANADHIHFYGLYTGNFPDLDQGRIRGLVRLLNGI